LQFLFMLMVFSYHSYMRQPWDVVDQFLIFLLQMLMLFLMLKRSNKFDSAVSHQSCPLATFYNVIEYVDRTCMPHQGQDSFHGWKWFCRKSLSLPKTQTYQKGFVANQSAHLTVKPLKGLEMTPCIKLFTNPACTQPFLFTVHVPYVIIWSAYVIIMILEDIKQIN